jgi:hypothetical protein
MTIIIIIYIVDKSPWTSDQPVARPLPTHRTTQSQNRRTHRHLCLKWYSNPRPQGFWGRRPFMISTARQLFDLQSTKYTANSVETRTTLRVQFLSAAAPCWRHSLWTIEDGEFRWRILEFCIPCKIYCVFCWNRAVCDK